MSTSETHMASSTNIDLNGEASQTEEGKKERLSASEAKECEF